MRSLKVRGIPGRGSDFARGPWTAGEIHRPAQKDTGEEKSCFGGRGRESSEYEGKPFGNGSGVSSARNQPDRYCFGRHRPRSGLGRIPGSCSLAVRVPGSSGNPGPAGGGRGGCGGGRAGLRFFPGSKWSLGTVPSAGPGSADSGSVVSRTRQKRMATPKHSCAVAAGSRSSRVLPSGLAILRRSVPPCGLGDNRCCLHMQAELFQSQVTVTVGNGLRGGMSRDYNR